MVFIKNLIEKIDRDNVFTQAAALTLYITFSLAPLVILIVYLLSTLRIHLQKELLYEVTEITGQATADVFKTLIEKAQERSDLRSQAGWIGLATLALSASAIFAQLQTSLNVIFCCKPINTGSLGWGKQFLQYLMKRIFTMLMVFGFIAIAIASFVISSAISGAISQSSQDSLWEVQVANIILSLLTFSALFTIMFKWLPDREISFIAAFEGGFLTALLFVLGKTLIGIYIGQTAIGSAFGAAGSLAILLIWFYYSAVIVFFGAEISATLLNRNNRGWNSNGASDHAKLV